jgi:hypothetical protein
MSKAVKTRAQWAAAIRAAHRKTVAAFLKTGRMLIAAKKALPHGAFLEMIKRDLPFTASTAQRLMKIAADPKMRKAAHAQHLPKAWPTLYELTKLPDAAFKQALSSGAIHPHMTRGDVRAITVGVETQTVSVPVYKTVEQEPMIIVSPVYNRTDDEVPSMRLVASAREPERADASPPDMTSLALSQIERLVGDLALAVKRGDVRADTVFEGRIRAVADRLLCLIDYEHSTAIN